MFKATFWQSMAVGWRANRVNFVSLKIWGRYLLESGGPFFVRRNSPVSGRAMVPYVKGAARFTQCCLHAAGLSAVHARDTNTTDGI